MRLKKSYDYFKTLKLLSEEIFITYDKMIKNKDFSANRISFFAEKSELINNLRNEFITPLERGDIFFLVEYLNAELDSVLDLYEYLSLVNKNDFIECEALSESLKNQSIVFSQLKNFKSNVKLFEKCSVEISGLNKEKKNIEKNIVDALKCTSEQPLIKYALYSALMDLNIKICKTFLQIERILIDNS